ncbi:MAG TPA: hypothetical protein VLA49_13420 [Anaerolineales bacterium]|nr:hypothetical protein [Anaerolineales bacterium]
MPWKKILKDDPLPWLLEPEDPGARYLALRDLLERPDDDQELAEARQKAYTAGPIATILANMQPEGYWSKPGPGYNPKYYSSVWAIITLAQLGASISMDDRIGQACEHLLEHALTEGGHFSASGAPSGSVDCLQGNLCAAMIDLGYEDGRLKTAFEWMACSVTGEGVASKEERAALRRYYAGKCGPNFACGANNKLPCAWGGVKVMLAFGKLPVQERTPLIEAAIQTGVDFFLSVNPASAGYPNGWSDKPSRNWWKFGFPVYYVTDLLQLVEALVSLGYGKDERLEEAVDLILEKQDPHGRWALEYDYAGKTWVEFGAKKQPNKWVTLRALKVLKNIN